MRVWTDANGAITDWQVWIQEGSEPLPLKYVLTTKDDPVHPQYIVFMSNWDTSPNFGEEVFRFTPPAGAKETEFIRMVAVQ